MSQERRLIPRYRLDTVITVGDGTGRIVNLSSRGVYFETSQRLAAGDRIQLVFPFERTGPGASVKCTADVVRVESRGDDFGVAAIYEPVIFSVPA